MQRRLADRLLPTLLDRIRMAPTVFHRKGKRIIESNAAWKTACAKAEVPGKLFHDLRRTAVRNLIRAGIPQQLAMRISGHRSDSMFERYNIVATEDLRVAAEKVQLYVDGLPTETEEAR